MTSVRVNIVNIDEKRSTRRHGRSPYEKRRNPTEDKTSDSLCDYKGRKGGGVPETWWRLCDVPNTHNLQPEMGEYQTPNTLLKSDRNNMYNRGIRWSEIGFGGRIFRIPS